MTRLNRRSVLLGAASLGIMSPAIAQTAAKKVRFAIDWTWEGTHAIWSLASDKGYFAAEKLDVSIDRGYGSTDNLTKLATGALDVASADPNLLLKFNNDNPNNQLICFFITYDASPGGIYFPKSTGIKAPKDLEGKKLSSTTTTAPAMLFPLFAKLNGVETSRVELLAVTAQLRDALVMQKKADGGIGFITSAAPSFVYSGGMNLEDIGFLQYNKYGIDICALGLICRKEYAEKNPDVLQSFVRGAVQGARYMVANPQEAITSVKRRDPLLDERVETLKNKIMNDIALVTPNVREHGMSSVKKPRLEKALEQIATIFNFKAAVNVDNIYTDRYLGDEKSRIIV